MDALLRLFRRSFEFNLYLASKLISSGAALGINGLVSRSLGPETFGLFMSASVTALILAAIVDGNIVARGIAKWHEDEDGFTRWLTHAIGFRVLFGVGAVAAMSAFALARGWTPQRQLAAAWCVLLIVQPLRFLEIELVASARFRALAAASLISSSCAIALAAASYVSGWIHHLGVSLALILFSMLGAGPYLLWTQRQRNRVRPHLPSLQAEAMLTFSFGVTQGLSMVLDALPYIVIPRFFGNTLAGLYAASTKVIQTYVQAVSLSLPFFLAKVRQRDWNLLKLFAGAGIVGLIALGVLGAVGKWAILAVNGPAFAGAAKYFWLLGGLVIAIPIGQLCMGVAGLRLRPRLPFVSVMLCLVCLIVALSVLWPVTLETFLLTYGGCILATTLWQAWMLLKKPVPAKDLQV